MDYKALLAESLGKGRDIHHYKNNSELNTSIYEELRSPAFNLFQPSTPNFMVPSQSSNSSDGSSMDFSTSRLLESQTHNLACNQTGHILSQDQRKHFKGLILVAKNLIKSKKLRKEILAANIAKINGLPLEVLWWYHSSEIMHLIIYISLNLNKSEKLERLGSGLCELMMSPSGDGMEGAITTDFLSALCRMVHGPEPPTDLRETRKACTIILQSIIRKNITAIKTDAGTIWWLQKLVEKDFLPLEVTKPFGVMLLRLQLTEPPFVSVHQALTRQSKWSFNVAPKILTTFYSLVFKAVQSPSLILEILKTVLQGGYEVNWKAVLICVSAFLQKLPDEASLMSDFISRLVTLSFANDNKELMLTAFLIARQCSVEGSAVGCLTYPIWFKKSFGSRTSSLVSTLSQWKFLLEFLTQLVPHEPAECLKAHVDHPPAAPTACRSQVQDYISLANTRLRDLGQIPKEKITGLFPMENGNAKTLEEQVQYDVEQALSYFESNGKLHKSIYEGSMFQKKYFEQHFLPALLKPRKLLSTNDTHMLFMDKLLSAGKISTQQFNKYHTQCLAAVSSATEQVPSEVEPMIL